MKAKEEKTMMTIEPKESENTPFKDIILSIDVVKMLGISNSTLKNLRRAHAFPFYKVGRNYRYRRSEIINYLEDQRDREN